MKKETNIDLKSIGNRIRQARKRLDVTQEYISEVADISAQYWSAIETGRERGSINTYLQIADALGVTINELVYSEAELIRMKNPGFPEALSECSEYEKAVIIEVSLMLRDLMIRYRVLK